MAENARLLPACLQEWERQALHLQVDLLITLFSDISVVQYRGNFVVYFAIKYPHSFFRKERMGEFIQFENALRKCLGQSPRVHRRDEDQRASPSGVSECVCLAVQCPSADDEAITPELASSRR